MDAARKELLSIKAKERWAACKVIGVLTRNSASTIQYHWSKIPEDVRKAALDGDTDALEQIKTIINTTTRIYEPKEEEELSTADKLKVSMWFIRKIGSVDQAIDAVKIAGEAIKKLERK